MFDPNSIKKYSLFHGDAVHVLLNFKPKSIHSCFFTPGVMSDLCNRLEPWEDFFGYRAQWFQLLYETIRDDGSLFVNLNRFCNNTTGIVLCNMMEKIGWKKQYGTGFGDGENSMHWTKSDNFYENLNKDTQPILEEDFELFKNKMNDTLEFPYLMDDSDLLTTEPERICKYYTPPNGITLEPTVGYGRHIISALRYNRRAVGIDCNKQMLSVCARRVNMLKPC